MGESLIVRRGIPKLPPWEGNNVPYYWEGEEFTDLTGGWVETPAVETGVQSKESDHLFLQLTGGGTQSPTRGYRTNHPVNLSDIKTLKINLDQTNAVSGGSERRYSYRISTSETGTPIAAFGNYYTNGVGTITIDVSNLNSDYYILVRQLHDGGATGTSSSKTYKIWGEK